MNFGLKVTMRGETIAVNSQILAKPSRLWILEFEFLPRIEKDEILKDQTSNDPKLFSNFDHIDAFITGSNLHNLI